MTAISKDIVKNMLEDCVSVYKQLEKLNRKYGTISINSTDLSVIHTYYRSAELAHEFAHLLTNDAYGYHWLTSNGLHHNNHVWLDSPAIKNDDTHTVIEEADIRLIETLCDTLADWQDYWSLISITKHSIYILLQFKAPFPFYLDDFIKALPTNDYQIETSDCTTYIYEYQGVKFIIYVGAGYEQKHI